MKKVLVDKLSCLDNIDEFLINRYVDFCLLNDTTNGITEHHHILPKSLFPEYKNLNEHRWNGTHLSIDNHKKAHSLLASAIYNEKIFAAWWMMHQTDENKNSSEHYLKAIEYKKAAAKKANTSMVVATDGIRNIRISKEEFDLRDDLAGVTINRGGDHLIGRISVIENGIRKSIPKEEFDPLKHTGITKGKTMYRDKDGIIFQCSCNDPRVLSGELIGIRKGYKFKNRNSKGQQVRINIYNENDQIVHECLGNFNKICKENKYPLSSLRKTMKTGAGIKNAKKKEFNGWYAKKLTKSSLL